MTSRFSSRLVAALAVILFLSMVAGGCGTTQSPESLVQDRCTGCHTLAPIEAARKTGQEWERTVYRMIRRGARLSDREAQAVIDYLSEAYGIEGP